MEINGRVAYEIALNRVLEKEKQLIELTALYTEALNKIKVLQEELEELKSKED